MTRQRTLAGAAGGCADAAFGDCCPALRGGAGGRRLHGKSRTPSRPTTTTPAAPTRIVERRPAGGGRGGAWVAAARSVLGSPYFVTGKLLLEEKKP